jgi:diguanylate cyclase (GGDEF)-like protein/PAS domain S-box-containing protein
MSGSTLRSQPGDSDELLTTRGPAFAAALAGVGFGAVIAVCLLLWSRELRTSGEGADQPLAAAHSIQTLSMLLLLVLSGAAATLLLIWWRTRRPNSSRDARYRAVLEQSPTGTLIADADSLAIIDANPAFQQSVGYSMEQLRRMTLPQLFSIGRTDPEAMLKLQDPVPRLPVALTQRCRDGSVLDVEATGHRLAVGARPVLAFTISDVSVRRKIEAQLLEKQQHLDHLAHHDQLTGLPNRLYLAHHLPGAIHEAKRNGTLLAVLFLDLDRFKQINDSRGHETGDKLLKQVAERVRATVRAEDVVVRMGGDEFIVVLQSIRSTEVINEMAARINAALSAPVVVDGHPLVTTASIGVGLYPRDGADMGELLRHSDTAMYQAKDRGRNNFQLFNPTMARRLREGVAIEASLRSALERGHLDVHYQPIIDISSNHVRGLEALLRWKHPTHGYILPGRFIDIAEETGLIVPVGEFVLQRVMRDVTHWRRAGATMVPIAVNISAVQLQRSNLPEKIEQLCRAHDISPSLLQIELTETAMFERRERGGPIRRDSITQLRDLGITIAIDDFGTGYSSLGYLKQWHVDYLKIDRRFVRDLVTDMSDLAIVGAIIAMARHLNIKAVAEGIEGWQQLEKLRQLGCALAQGYLFAKPAPADQCASLLMGQPISLIRSDEPSPLNDGLGDGTGGLTALAS